MLGKRKLSYMFFCIIISYGDCVLYIHFESVFSCQEQIKNRRECSESFLLQTSVSVKRLYFRVLEHQGEKLALPRHTPLVCSNKEFIDKVALLQ